MDTSEIKEISKGITEIRNGGNTVWGGGLPGPKKLIGGNLQAGFYGEASASSFITGDELAQMIGLTAGKSQNSNGGWLKFSYLGNTEYVAKKPFRRSISWNHINAVNAVFGSRTILIKGNAYKIRLMKGKTEGKQRDSSSEEGSICHNSEWNRLMLPIHKDASSNWNNYNVEARTENWKVNYTNDDLLGVMCWCQEYGFETSFRMHRGGASIYNSGSDVPRADYDYYWWRPVLELVR